MTAPVSEGDFCCAAPGCGEWWGNYTDYNDGPVLGIGLDVGTTVSAAKRADRVLRLEARDLGESCEVSLEALYPLAAGWANYVLGVAAGFVARGAQAGGLDLAISSTLPIGVGLSSSAALECATGRAL
ncbi:MAG: galactokinase family protein [Chthoniobacterales bacterium]|jgi:galactokinase